MEEIAKSVERFGRYADVAGLCCYTRLYILFFKYYLLGGILF